MIQLTVNPIVLQTLQQHFPKPNNSAPRALDKYVMLMTAQISDSIIRGRTVHQVIKGLYTFSIYKQRTRGSQIGSKKIRLQNWLEENNLKLFRVVELGTSRSHKLSVIQLTDLVTLTNTMTVLKSEEELETENLQNLLYTQAVSNKQLFESLYPEIEDLNEFDIRNLFEFVPIDVRSLRNYIQWLGHDSTLIDARKKAQYLVQADTILRVAQHTDGFYVQRRKASSFGRTYYSGISVQNVNKELRRAMLGHCWDYDVRSAVFAWKMGFARECHASMGTTEPFEKVFSTTLGYIYEKKDFMMTLRYYTFSKDSNVSREQQEKLLKKAVTAISFGARDRKHGWLRVDGTWKNPALMATIRNSEERERFVNCALMRKFIAEQNALDSYLFDSCKKAKAEFLSEAVVRNIGGSLSKSKVIAYLYQHGETILMDLVHAEIEKRGGVVLARIHDAIIVKRRLGADHKIDIELAIRAQTENPYWHLQPTELEPYHRPLSLDKEEIQAHQARIAAEEQAAKRQIELKRRSAVESCN